MQTATTAGNANFADPSQDTLEEMIPKAFQDTIQYTIHWFIIQVNSRAITVSGKSHGSMKITRKIVLP